MLVLRTKSLSAVRERLATEDLPLDPRMVAAGVVSADALVPTPENIARLQAAWCFEERDAD